MTRSNDQQVIEALAPNSTDPAFRVGIRVRSPNRCAQDLGADRTPHAVEGRGELGVAVTDQMTHHAPAPLQRRCEVAGPHGTVGSRRVIRSRETSSLTFTDQRESRGDRPSDLRRLG